MKLNHDCVRDVLLDIEENMTLNEYLGNKTLESFPSFTKYGFDDFYYSIAKLSEAGYLVSHELQIDGAINIIARVDSLTWEGHKFLDTIRDNKVWKNTKAIVSNFSSVSLSLIEKIASDVLTNLISKQMGL